jgi:ubiquinone/menaquinone biosynthesis C-methylase UbiE
LTVGTREHWERIYLTKRPDEVSWYRPHLDVSLRLIERSCPRRTASIVDVGGGESTLVDDLLAHGYRDVTVLDLSETAMRVARERLGAAAERVTWVQADVTSHPFDVHRFDVWHDRAVFHVLTDARATARHT